MKKIEKRNYIVRRVRLNDIDIEDLTDVEMESIIKQMEEDLELFANNKNLMSTADLFAYVALSYAMRLYQVENLEKTKQKAEEKRLDETIKRLENFLKNN